MSKTNLPALPLQPIPPDLVKEMAMDIGKEVAAYVERMYPQAVEATSSTFLLSLRNTVYNQIIEAVGTSEATEIEARLKRRKRERRELRALWKAACNIKPGEVEKAEAILRGDLPLEPDL